MTLFRFSASIMLFCFVLLAKVSFSQSISGKITNKTDAKCLYINYIENFVEKKDSIHISSNGLFSRSFNFDEPKYIWLTYNLFSKRLYVFPKAKLKIGFDALNDSMFNRAFEVKGDYGINHSLESIQESNIFPDFINSRVNLSLPIDSFGIVLNDFRRFHDSTNNSFFKTENINAKPVSDYLKTDSINWHYYSVLAAIDYHRLIKTGNKSKFINEQIRSQISFENNQLYINSDYYKKIWIYILKALYEVRQKDIESVKQNDLNFDLFVKNFITENKISGNLKDLIISGFLNSVIGNYRFQNIEKIQDSDSIILFFIGELQNKLLVNKISQNFAAEKKTYDSQIFGKKAPSFLASDTTGRIYNLEDFKGKVILLDIWATWCLPCRQEFPYLATLEEKLKDYGRFKLLSLSIDELEDKWIDGIKKYRPPGLSLLVKNPLALGKAYNFHVIPLTILIDEKGRFIEYNTARASDGDKLFKKIFDYLNSNSF